MVVSIGKATSADYYTRGGGVAEQAESYYLDAVTDGEPPGRWSGSGAAKLGLAGEVDPDDMHTLYSTFTNPITDEQIGARPAQRMPVEDRIADALAAEPNALPERIEQIRRTIERSDRQSVIGWDATFSVPKSVTVAHTAAHRAEIAAIRSGDIDRAQRFRTIRIGIEDAIHEANGAMLAYAETVTTARAGGGAGAPVEWKAAPGLTVASFFQHTSRSIDPQLHVHNVILNRAYCSDGKARSLDGQDLLAQRAAFGAIAERVLEERLAQLGFHSELRPDGAARELTIIPEQVSDLYSSRSRQVTARVADLVEAAQERMGRELTDLELHRLKARATLATRASKHGHPAETTEELVDRWAAELPSVGQSLDALADQIDAHLREAPDREGQTSGLSVDATISEAVAACAEQRSTWGRPNLMLEISRRLPHLRDSDGQPLESKAVVDLLERITDHALTGEEVVQVSGHASSTDEVAGTATGPSAALADDPFTRPSARLYASRDTLTAETALRLAAITRGRHAVDSARVAEWLDERCPSIGADQRAAVEGIAASDAALTVLVGPAGTGKSFAAGAFAGAWQELTGGTVVGLAVSQVATMVLRDDGIDAARNITQWLNTHDRLANPTGGSPEDEQWRVGPRDVVMVDEASMVATADLERIRSIVDAAGARLVLTGDPNQLGAVEAGGVMGLLDGHAETYTLTEVRRFATDWERAASLDLRRGHVDALAQYDRHGRLQGHEDIREALDVAARAAVADRLDGRSVVVVTDTNAQAAAIASTVRARLVELGLVEEAGVLLGRDGCTAGVGDVIACRRNEYTLGVTNRVQYRVTATAEDGALIVETLDGEHEIHLPAAYVEDDVQLGYASTAHAAQGLTVDAGYVVTDGGMDASTLYVALTRGRLRNTAHVATKAETPELPAGLDGKTARPSAVAVLEAGLERDDTSRAATVEAERDHEQRHNLRHLAGRTEALTRTATRERMERHLDDLTAEGHLDEDTRARLCADQGAEHLSRLLRAVEQTGADPRQVLRDAVTARALTDADSVAQVLSHRITSGRPIAHPHLDFTHGTPAAIPADISDKSSVHLAHLSHQIDGRQRALGAQLADQPPPWALEAFGPVPVDGDARQEWQQRAGIVAGYREATGWDDEHRPIGSMPGLSATERRASYIAAWEALDRPETGLDEAAMSEGQLRVRVRAAQAERAWAPPHADDALRAAETAAEEARHQAALLRAEADTADQAGDTDRAHQLRTEAAEHSCESSVRAAAAEQLTVTADARGRWAASAAVTLDHGDRAETELTARGLTPGTEPDRTTAADWLAADQAARHADDAHRPITETDLIDHDRAASAWPPATDQTEPVAEVHPDDKQSQSQTRPADAASSTLATTPAAESSPAHQRISLSPSPAELEMSMAGAALVISRINDRASADAAHTDPDRDEAHATAEANRRRRESADSDTLDQPATTTRGSGHESGSDSGAVLDA